MLSSRRKQSTIHQHQLLIACLVLVLFARALIPQGYMPNFQADSWELEHCHGEAMSLASPDTTPEAEPLTPCSFSIAIGMHALGDDPQAIASSFPASWQAIPRLAQHFPSTYQKAAQARAPPQFS